MSNPIPWLPLLQTALDHELPDRPRIAVLATVDETGRPRARNIVIRQIDDSGALHLVSDSRSQKNRHLRQTPFGEIVFYLPLSRQQFRLAGPVTLTSPKDNAPQVQQFWSNLTDAARALFIWPAPGHPRHDDPNGFPTTLPAITPLPDTFEIITLSPDLVEHLQLTPTPHQRTRWQAQYHWLPEEINP